MFFHKWECLILRASEAKFWIFSETLFLKFNMDLVYTTYRHQNTMMKSADWLQEGFSLSAVSARNTILFTSSTLLTGSKNYWQIYWVCFFKKGITTGINSVILSFPFFFLVTQVVIWMKRYTLIREVRTL